MSAQLLRWFTIRGRVLAEDIDDAMRWLAYFDPEDDEGGHGSKERLHEITIEPERPPTQEELDLGESPDKDRQA